MSRSRIPIALGALTGAVLLASCKAAADCAPTDPVCNPGGAPIATITVTSPTVDTVMANGRTAQLVAQARDASNNPVTTVTLAWTSLNPSVATVDPTSGLVSAVATGSATIRVSQSQNAVTGQLQMRVVNANLPLLAVVVGDTLADAMRQALTNTPRTTIATGLNTCGGHITTGNLLALDTCLTGLSAVTGTNGNDNALLGVLDLFFDFGKRLINL